MEIKKILLCEGKMFAFKGEDLHTNFGLVKAEDIKDGKVKSNKGKEFVVLEPNFNDLINFMKRGPQMPLAKDIAVIMYYSGVDKDSKVLDAGSGSGLLTCSLARVAKKVVSYEVKESNHNLAKKNAEFFGLKNVEFKLKDIYSGIDEKDLDVITLDLPEPWQVLEHAQKALKLGGTLVTYLPSIKQVDQLVKEAKQKGFLVSKTIEVLEREWVVKENIVRPSHDMYGHTAFLTFLRKITA